MKFNKKTPRQWISECSNWEIFEMTFTRYRLFHLPSKRSFAGDYKTLEEAKKWAENIEKMLNELA